MSLSSALNSVKSLLGLLPLNGQDSYENDNYLTADPNGSSWQDFQSERPYYDENGFSLHEDVILPESVLELILSKLPIEVILNANQVCRAWKDITVLKSFWKRFYKANGINWENVPSRLKLHKNSWIAFYAEAKYMPFTKNFVKNHSGEDQSTHWNHRDGGNRGARWLIENPPAGCNPLPPDPMFGNNNTCFTSTYQHCYLIQEIKLFEQGFSPAIMKMSIPFSFHFSMMTAPRFDCSSEYDVIVHLINSQSALDLASDTIEGAHPRGMEWKKESVEIPSFTSEVEGDLYPDKVLVKIRAKDTQFWAGHYGAKISRVCLRVNVN